MDEREYLGIYDVPYTELIIVKIKAHDYEVAKDKFIECIDKKGYMVDETFLYVIPLFSEFEII